MRTLIRCCIILLFLGLTSHALNNYFVPLLSLSDTLPGKVIGEAFVKEAHAQIGNKKPANPIPLPEPSTLILLSTGLAGVGIYKLMRRKKSGRQ